MRYRGLLHKTKFQVFVILVLCIQLIGPPPLSPISSVKSEGLEPTIVITSPVSGSSLNEEDVVITGSVENFPIEALVKLYLDEVEIETPIQVVDKTWSTQLTLSKGSHTILAQSEVEGIQIVSDPVEITIDPILPIMSMTKPINGEFVNVKVLEGSTEPSATVKICMDCTMDSDDIIIGSWSSIQADSTGKWVYQNPELTEGNHTVYAKAIDSKGNTSNVIKVEFHVDTLRPQVLPDVFPKQDMTQVPLNPVIKVKISDANVLNEAEIKTSINVSQNGTKVEGTINYNRDTKEITFTPLEALTPSKKYNVFISPLGIIDAAKNSAFPRFWSFTTVGIKSEKHPNPHGSYTNNVDTCGNCHSTHNAQDANLLVTKTKTETSTPEVITIETIAETNQPKDLVADKFCMSCHDGTVVAPLPENSKAVHTHDAAVEIDGTPSGSSCGSCHNPHLERSENNPNMAQDHITYTHQPSNQVDPNKPTEEISSKEQLCESCHENDSAEKIAHEDVEYSVFKYSKSSTATGIYEDYELCLRCHNEDFNSKYNKSADIASHYNNLTEEIMKQYEKTNGPLSFANREISVAEKNFSGHIIEALDGSPLAGHLPCAECHDTHGSNNLKQLKTSLGHENVQSFTAGDTDSKNVKVVLDNKEVEFSILSDSKGRAFCLACHNGTTAIYGVTGEKYDTARTEHKTYPSKSCSYCHGRGETEVEKALSAAHAPKKGLIPR
ncbi:Ig-like domain-containing protein [Neobacillus sp. CF12]|uniref:Ig-like domain-containing protein n=1 Tax=Neobacillus sp. CF12 TaxID=3055864 RepID=UPI0025A17D21|nr:Ig-like domain-containing protein [Neobacillus sp. CF12]MDM5330290.1 Ig-like domain-containing protein [Neobacillus sp. CF12]